MNRLIVCLVSLLVPVAAAAQVPPPAPAAPPAPPAPVVAPAPPAAPEPPAALRPLDVLSLQDKIREVEARAADAASRAADLAADRLQSGDLKATIDSAMAEARASIAEQMAKLDGMPELREQLNALRDQMPMMLAQGPEPVSPGRGRVITTPRPPTSPTFVFTNGIEGGAYTSGLNALGNRQFDRAITLFDQVINQKASNSDGALYWKAWAQYKLAKTEDALTTIALLRKDYGQSRYLGDAKVLETDVRKAAGQPVNLNALAADEDIKILAIQGIQKSEPEKAVPLLEGVLTASNSLRIKKQAIYVLALSDDARAHQVLLKYAKGAGNPDLQSEAIRYLASRSDKQTTSAELREIYESTQDATVRRAIIDAYRAAGDKTAIFAIANNNGQPMELRSAAVSRLSGLASAQELSDIFQKEPDPELRRQIVNVLVSMNAYDQLLQIAKTEKDPNVRGRAIQALGNQKTDKTSAMLIDLYSGESDTNVRMKIIDSLAIQNNAEALVALARKENSLDLKRAIVRHLSDMAPKNKVAADYLMEVIK